MWVVGERLRHITLASSREQMACAKARLTPHSAAAYARPAGDRRKRRGAGWPVRCPIPLAVPEIELPALIYLRLCKSTPYHLLIIFIFITKLALH